VLLTHRRTDLHQREKRDAGLPWFSCAAGRLPFGAPRAAGLTHPFRFAGKGTHTMPTMDDIRQGETPFDPFLYAAVGEDRNGNPVTVLSTLARLGLEPWDAAADLASLTRAEARTRLGGMLARFGDVPALGRDHAAITLRLIELLPKATGRTAGRAMRRPAPSGAIGIGPILAILMLILYLVHTLFLGSDGAGN